MKYCIHKISFMGTYVIEKTWEPEKWIFLRKIKRHNSRTEIVLKVQNKMNCELMLTYDTPALWQTGNRNLTGPKTLPMIWGTYMKLVTKYQISAINSC